MSNPILTIKPPPKSKPGFMRRQREVLRIQEALRKEATVENFDAMIDLMLKECEVIVSNGTDPREALLDLSEDEYTAVMDAMRGAESAVVPPNGA